MIKTHTHLPNEIIELNVGGTYFTTRRSTLIGGTGTKDTFFTVLLEDRFGVAKDNNGRYFIDRDPVMFSVILNFLRTGDLIMPSHISRTDIAKETKFYGIDFKLTKTQVNSMQNAIVNDSLIKERLTQHSSVKRFSWVEQNQNLCELLKQFIFSEFWKQAGSGKIPSFYIVPPVNEITRVLLTTVNEALQFKYHCYSRSDERGWLQLKREIENDVLSMISYKVTGIVVPLLTSELAEGWDLFKWWMKEIHSTGFQKQVKYLDFVQTPTGFRKPTLEFDKFGGSYSFVASRGVVLYHVKWQDPTIVEKPIITKNSTTKTKTKNNKNYSEEEDDDVSDSSSSSSEDDDDDDSLEEKNSNKKRKTPEKQIKQKKHKQPQPQND